MTTLEKGVFSWWIPEDILLGPPIFALAILKNDPSRSEEEEEGEERYPWSLEDSGLTTAAVSSAQPPSVISDILSVSRYVQEMMLFMRS